MSLAFLAHGASKAPPRRYGDSQKLLYADLRHSHAAEIPALLQFKTVATHTTPSQTQQVGIEWPIKNAPASLSNNFLFGPPNGTRLIGSHSGKWISAGSWSQRLVLDLERTATLGVYLVSKVMDSAITERERRKEGTFS